jgi:hypothetical protein
VRRQRPQRRHQHSSEGAAHRWRRKIESSRAKSITDLAEQEDVTAAYVCRLLPLTRGISGLTVNAHASEVHACTLRSRSAGARPHDGRGRRSPAGGERGVCRRKPSCGARLERNTAWARELFAAVQPLAFPGGIRELTRCLVNRVDVSDLLARWAQSQEDRR